MFYFCRHNSDFDLQGRNHYMWPAGAPSSRQRKLALLQKDHSLWDCGLFVGVLKT